MNKSSKEGPPKGGPFSWDTTPQQALAYLGTMTKEAVGRLIADLLVLGSAACDASMEGSTSMPVSLGSRSAANGGSRVTRVMKPSLRPPTI